MITHQINEHEQVITRGKNYKEVFNLLLLLNENSFFFIIRRERERERGFIFENLF